MHIKTKLHYVFYILFLFIFLFVAHSTVSAQYENRRKRSRNAPRSGTTARSSSSSVLKTGTGLQGNVIDALTGEPMVGASVLITELNKGAFTDQDGAFSFAGLKPGRYTVVVSFSGYDSQRIREIKIESDAGARVNVSLSEAESVTMAPVVVEAKMRESSDAALLNVQRNALQVSDGYSGDMVLRQTPDLQTDVALRRMPGVAMLEDKFLSVRGLYERYVNFTFNNVVLPVSDLERSGFNMSLIPANLISSIRLIKTATADLVPEFAGGQVQIETVAIPDENLTRLAVQGGYNDRSTFKELLTYPTKHNSFGLFSQVKNFLPDNFPSTASINAAPISSEERYAAARQTNRNFFPTKTTAAPGLNLNATFQRRGKINGKTVGAVVYLNYLNDWQFDLFKLNLLGNFDSQLGYNPVIDSSLNAQPRRRQVGTAMANMGIELDARNKISFRNLFNYQNESVALFVIGQAFNPFSEGNVWLKYANAIQRFTEQKFYNGALSGEHTFRDAATHTHRLDWQVNFVYSDFQDPGFASTSFDHYPELTPDSLPDKNVGASYFFPGSRDVFAVSMADVGYTSIFTAKNTERNVGGRINYSLRFANQKNNALKNIGVDVGIFTNFRYKNFRSRLTGVYYPTDSQHIAEYTLPVATASLSNYPHIFDDQNIGLGGFTFIEKTDDKQNYDARADNVAGYAQARWTPNAAWRFNAGLRLDYFRQFIGYYPINGDARRELLDRRAAPLLPSLGVVYRTNERTNLRLAFAQTVVRPLDRDLAGFTFLNYLNGIRFVGNPDVQPSKITHLDLRYEFFPTGKELLSVSLFYKYFDRPIEQIMAEGFISQQKYQYANAQRAVVGGIEVEARINVGTRLKIKKLEDFTLYGNASFIRSRVNVGAFDLATEGRGMQGQAKYIFNAGLIYTEPQTKISLSAFYNRVGERIAIVGIGDTTFASWWELPRDLLDLQIGWKTPNNRWEFRALLNDVLNQPTRIVQLYEGRTTFDAAKDKIAKETRRGWNLLLSVAYRF